MTFPVAEKVIENAAKSLQNWPVRSNRASEIGHPCLLYKYLLRTAWEMRKQSSDNKALPFIFALGREIEDIAIQEIKDAGFAVLEQGRSYEWQKYGITGKLDLKIAETKDHNAIAYPCEVKGLQGYDCDKLNSVEDFLNSEKKWLVKYPAQLLTYLLLDNKPMGLFYLKNKQSMLPKDIWVKLDDYLQIAEDALKSVEQVNAYMVSKAKPEDIIREHNIKYVDFLCDGCDFAHMCPVGTTYTGIEIVINEILEKKLSRRDELAAAVKEYDAIDEEIKEMFRGKPDTIVGNFSITGKPYKTTSYDIPAEIKKQYAIAKESWRCSIKKLSGGIK